MTNDEFFRDMKTPWGPGATITQYATGFFVARAEGKPDGVMMSEVFVKKHLSQEAIKRARRHQRNFIFDGVNLSIVFFELGKDFPQIVPKNIDVLEMVSAFHPDYLEERKIAPNPKAHAMWVYRQSLAEKCRLA